MTVSVGSPAKIVHMILLTAKTLSRNHNHVESQQEAIFAEEFLDG